MCECAGLMHTHIQIHTHTHTLKRNVMSVGYMTLLFVLPPIFLVSLIQHVS